MSENPDASRRGEVQLLTLPLLALVKHGVEYAPKTHDLEDGAQLTLRPSEIKYCYGYPETGLTALVTADGTEHIVPIPLEDFRRIWLNTFPDPDAASATAVPAAPAVEEAAG